jgi:hypothetical protein
MNSPLMQAMRSRWFAIGIHAGLWCVLYLAVIHLGGKTPDFRIAESSTAPSPGPVPVAKMDSLFTSAEWPISQGGTNTPNPFFTSYFVPAPSPTPPAPTTRKIEVTYQGFYTAGDDVKHAVVKVADSFVVASIGAPIVTNLFVADAGLQNLMLTNLTAQTNLLLLNTKKEIEIPIK